MTPSLIVGDKPKLWAVPKNFKVLFESQSSERDSISNQDIDQDSNSREDNEQDDICNQYNGYDSNSKER